MLSIYNIYVLIYFQTKLIRIIITLFFFANRANMITDLVWLFIFRMDPNPFLRNTFWTVSIGTIFQWIAQLGIHPGAVQRFVALPTYNKARSSLIYFVLGMAIVKVLTGSVGMLMYTKYQDCDPSLANVRVFHRYYEHC